MLHVGASEHQLELAKTASYQGMASAVPMNTG
jgi:hypothetical protein